MSLIRVVARPMLASMFVAGGINALRETPVLAPKAQAVTDRVIPALAEVMPQVPLPTNAATWVRITGAVHVVGGAMLATGHLPRLTSWTLAGTLVPTTFVGHAFWQHSDPVARKNQSVHFFKNISMIGGLLMAGIDSDPHKKMLVTRAKNKVKELAPG